MRLDLCDEEDYVNFLNEEGLYDDYIEEFNRRLELYEKRKQQQHKEIVDLFQKLIVDYKPRFDFYIFGNVNDRKDTLTLKAKNPYNKEKDLRIISYIPKEDKLTIHTGYYLIYYANSGMLYCLQRNEGGVSYDCGNSDMFNEGGHINETHFRNCIEWAFNRINALPQKGLVELK